MKIKVCGMRNLENISAVGALGIDYMGFIFYEKSKRYVGQDFVMPEISDSIVKTGVFVNESLENILILSHKHKLQAIQLHGNESPEMASELMIKGYTVLKAIAIAGAESFGELTQWVNCCNYLLFDTSTPQHGGSGLKFDWKVLNAYELNIPFFLSGGIGAEDAAAIKALAHPRLKGIDLNSKFETEPALKDVEKLKDFITQLKFKH